MSPSPPSGTTEPSKGELLTWLQQMHGYQQGMNGKLDQLIAMHGELPAHLRPAWPETEFTFNTMLPMSDPTARLEVIVTARPTGLLLRVRLNGYLELWRNEVFFRERALDVR